MRKIRILRIDGIIQRYNVSAKTSKKYDYSKRIIAHYKNVEALVRYDQFREEKRAKKKILRTHHEEIEEEEEHRPRASEKLVGAQEISVYGSMPSNYKKKKRDMYKLIQFSIIVPKDVTPDDIRNYLESIGVYNAYEQGDIASERKFDKRVTVAGEFKAIDEDKVSMDWKKDISDAVENSREREDKHKDFTRREKKTVRKNTKEKEQFAKKEEEFYNGSQGDLNGFY